LASSNMSSSRKNLEYEYEEHTPQMVSGQWINSSESAEETGELDTCLII